MWNYIHHDFSYWDVDLPRLAYIQAILTHVHLDSSGPLQTVDSDGESLRLLQWC